MDHQNNKKWFQKIWFKALLCLSLGLLFLLSVFISRDPTLSLMLSKPKEVKQVETLKTTIRKEEVNRQKVEESMKRALAFLKSQQNQDGSWMDHAGITAMTLSAILKTPFHDLAVQSYIQTSLNYLLEKQQSNGAFYTPFSVSVGMANYITSSTVMALVAADKQKYQTQIKKATDYLASVQRIEGTSEGGLGYGAHGSGADLSNLHMALEAMREAGVDPNSPFFKKALSFVSKCQDSESNETIQGSASGGFAYKPDVLHSGEDGAVYGGMAYAGLDSLLLCEVEMSDPRVQDVFQWIEQNYSVDSHPGKGDLSLFFYYATMAKALQMSKVKMIQTKSGEKNWAKDLAYKILKLQQNDGSWVNENPKYFEGYPVMASAYALKALNDCWPNL